MNQQSHVANVSKPGAQPNLQWAPFYWAAFLLSVVVATRPFVVFFNSNDEFSLSLAQVAEFSGLIFSGLLAGLVALRLVVGLKVFAMQRQRVSAMLLAVAVLLWVQGNFFLWNYGKLDGRPLNFEAYAWHGGFEALLWLAILAIAAFKYQWLLRWTKKLVLVVLASLLLSSTMAYLDRPRDLWHKQYHVVLDNYLNYSQQKNVIVLAIDAARGDVFQEMLAEMSQQEKQVFDGFTFFRNTTGTFNSTDPAVSGILTGQLYDFKKPKDRAYRELFLSPTSLPYQLKKAGFVSEVYPYNISSVFISPEIVDNLKPNEEVGAADKEAMVAKDLEKISLVTRFNFAPHYLKKLFFDSSEMYATAAPSPASQPAAAQSGNTESQASKDVAAGQADISESNKSKSELPPNILVHLAYSREIIQNLETRLSFRPEPVFKYLHYHGAHPPFFHDENYEGLRQPFSMGSYKKQYKGALLLTLKALTDSLKKQGVYDDTMLIVIGDHGLYIPRKNEALAEGDMDGRVIASLLPLLMIKPFGEANSPVRTSSAPVSMFDLAPTVLKALDINIPRGMRSVFDIAEDEQRQRVAFSLALTTAIRPGANEDGAIEYKITGDAYSATAWRPTHKFLRLHEGKVELDTHEFQTTARELSEYLDNTSRFEMND